MLRIDSGSIVLSTDRFGKVGSIKSGKNVARWFDLCSDARLGVVSLFLNALVQIPNADRSLSDFAKDLRCIKTCFGSSGVRLPFGIVVMDVVNARHSNRI